MSFSTSFYLCLASFCVFFKIGNSWRIIGGRPSLEGEFPYQVSLRRSYNNRHFCGGSIITSQHILTAAHCVYYTWAAIVPPHLISVTAGQIEILVTENSTMRRASKIIPHENFNYVSMANDIAIIELDRELPLDSNMLIAGISMRTIPTNKGKCIVSGWGVQEHDSEVTSDILMTAEVHIIDFTTCQIMYDKGNLQLSQGMLCAGHENGKRDSCQGDSGGPLVCDGLLTGIVSTGSGCGIPGFPGIYTDVAYYLSWIQKQIGNISMETTFKTTTDLISDESSDVSSTTLITTTELSTSDFTSTKDDLDKNETGTGGSSRNGTFNCISLALVFIILHLI